MKRTYNKAFENTFESLQCVCWSTLGYDFDFHNKEDLIKFQNGLTEHDKIIDDKNGYNSINDMLRTKYNLDCHKLACDFPYITKMHMANFDKRKDKAKAAIVGCNNSIETFLVICFYELISEWNFNRENLIKLYEKMVEYGDLYRQGMDRNFVKKYFKEYFDLDIQM